MSLCLSVFQEYTLAHVDLPDTLDGAEMALKKHEDFVSTMEANEEKIESTLQGGQRLLDSGNLNSGKVQNKMDSIRDRSVTWFYSSHWILNYIEGGKTTKVW